MGDQKIREFQHIVDKKLIVSVPDWLNDKDVEVIIVPRESTEGKLSRDEIRTRNILRSRGDIKISDDFDEELPDSFWSRE